MELDKTMAALIVALLVITVFGVSLSFAASLIDSSELVKTDLYGAKYTPQCLSDCHLVLKIKPGALADYSKSISDSYKYAFVDSKSADKASCFSDQHFNILVNESYVSGRTLESDIKCTDQEAKNGTKWQNCTENGKEKDVIAYRMVWKRLTDSIKPTKADYIYLDLTAKRKLTEACRNIDAIPTIYGAELKQYDWWNNGWSNYRNITISNVMAIPNQTVSLNLSKGYLTTALDSFQDVRLVDKAGTEIPYGVDYNVSGSWVNIWFIRDMPSGDETVSVYYGNSTAPSVAAMENTPYWIWNGLSIGDTYNYTSGGTLSNASGVLSANCPNNNDVARIGANPANRVQANMTSEIYGYQGGTRDGGVYSGLGLSDCLTPADCYFGTSNYALHLIQQEDVWKTWANGGGLYQGTTASGWATLTNLTIEYARPSVRWYVGGALANTDTSANPGTPMYATLRCKSFGTANSVNARYAMLRTLQPTSYSIGSEQGPELPPVPHWSSPSSSTPATYSPSTWSTFNITWNQATYSFIEGNWSGSAANSTMNGAGGNTTFGYQNILPAGSFYWKVYGQNVSAWNSTGKYEFSIAKADPALVVSSSAGWSIGEGTATSISCAGAATGTLMQNGTAVANPLAFSGSAGFYNYTCNVTENQNYSGRAEQLLTVLPSGLYVSARSESTGAAIAFNLTLANSTTSTTIEVPGVFWAAYTNGTIPRGELTITAASTGYGTRTYYAVTSSANITNVTAYLVPIGTGSYVRFHTLTNTYAAIPGVLVTANRSISGTSTLVGAMLSDASGTATFFLDPLIPYTITASKAGYSSYSGSITPSSTDYNIILSPSSSSINATTQFMDISWSFVPNGGLLTNVSTLFNFSITSGNNSLACGYGLSLFLNGTLIFNGTANNPAGSNITFTYNLWNLTGSTITATYWFTKCGYPPYFYNMTYQVISVSPGPFTLVSLLNDARTGICPVPTNNNGIIWCLPLNIIALLVSSIVGGGGAAKFSMNGGGIAFLACLWAFTIVGFFPWIASLVLTVLLIAVMARRSFS